MHNVQHNFWRFLTKELPFDHVIFCGCLKSQLSKKHSDVCCGFHSLETLTLVPFVAIQSKKTEHDVSDGNDNAQQKFGRFLTKELPLDHVIFCGCLKSQLSNKRFSRPEPSIPCEVVVNGAPLSHLAAPRVLHLKKKFCYPLSDFQWIFSFSAQNR